MGMLIVIACLVMYLVFGSLFLASLASAAARERQWPVREEERGR